MNKTPSPLITLIIPTRDRSDTLFFAIKTALAQDSDSYEIIVSDNDSRDNTREVVQGFGDERLKYFKTNERLSMCDNWEFALARARGRYAIFIGDDDAVVPGAIDRLMKLMERIPSQVYCWDKPTYVWPTGGRPGTLSNRSGSAAPRNLLLGPMAHFVVSMGGARYSFLPSVYHGLIATEILDAVRKKTGRVFHSTQPDIFSALSIPAFCESATNAGFAVTMGGQSKKANSAVVYGSEGVKVQEQFLAEYKGYRIHPTLDPEISIRANLLPDCVLVAMDRFPEFYAPWRFNYEAMWAYMIRLSRVYQWSVSPVDLIRQRVRIGRYHRFSVPKFLYYHALHSTVEIARRTWEKLSGRRAYEVAPDNIAEMARIYGADEGRRDASSSFAASQPK